jgi:hypothetical protein
LSGSAAARVLRNPASQAVGDDLVWSPTNSQTAMVDSYFQPPAIDLSAYAGQTIELVFHGTNDREDPTTFLIDDISVTAN